EAQAASALNHPNICTIYEIDEADGTLFIAMEYVEGNTLYDEIKSAPLELRKALEIAIQISSALEKTHNRGLIHRDIKPSNVALTHDGQVKILDFGLARVLKLMSNPPSSDATTGDAENTDSSTVAGTAAYMSPEQISGKELDGRSDMFAFGILLYEML